MVSCATSGQPGSIVQFAQRTGISSAISGRDRQAGPGNGPRTDPYRRHEECGREEDSSAAPVCSQRPHGATAPALPCEQSCDLWAMKTAGAKLTMTRCGTEQCTPSAPTPSASPDVTRWATRWPEALRELGGSPEELTGRREPSSAVHPTTIGWVIYLEDWALIRHLHHMRSCRSGRLPRLSVARKTVAAALASDGPPKYERAPVESAISAVEHLSEGHEYCCEHTRAESVETEHAWIRPPSALRGRRLNGGNQHHTRWRR
jgi:hypothetical protein